MGDRYVSFFQVEKSPKPAWKRRHVVGVIGHDARCSLGLYNAYIMTRQGDILGYARCSTYAGHILYWVDPEQRQQLGNAHVAPAYDRPDGQVQTRCLETTVSDKII